MNREIINELAELLQDNRDYDTAQEHFVSVYRKEQRFGGPEEGGWWYDTWMFDGSIRFPSENTAVQFLAVSRAIIEQRNSANAPLRHRALAALPDVATAFHDEGWIPLGWGDGGILHVIVEARAGEHDNSNEARPHYE